MENKDKIASLEDQILEIESNLRRKAIELEQITNQLNLNQEDYSKREQALLKDVINLRSNIAQRESLLEELTNKNKVLEFELEKSNKKLTEEIQEKADLTKQTEQNLGKIIKGHEFEKE